MSIYHDEQIDGVRFSNSQWAVSEGLIEEEEIEEDDE